MRRRRRGFGSANEVEQVAKIYTEAYKLLDFAEILARLGRCEDASKLWRRGTGTHEDAQLQRRGLSPREQASLKSRARAVFKLQQSADSFVPRRCVVLNGR
jgi:hypothetical protein